MSNKLKRLVESFGEEVVMVNMTEPASKHFTSNNILRDVDSHKLDHLEYCGELDLPSILRIVGGMTGKEVDINSPQLPQFINDFCGLVFSCGSMFGDNMSVGNGTISIVSDEAMNHFQNGVETVTQDYLCESKNIGSSELKDVLDNNISDDQITLLRNMFSASKDYNYNPKFRNEVFDHITRFPDSPPSSIIRDVYFKESVGEDTIGTVVDVVGLEEAKKIQSGGIHLIETKSGIMSVSKASNGYSFRNYNS